MAGTREEVIDARKTLCDDPVLHLSKLAWEIAQIRERTDVLPAERIFMSINAAMTGWHIHEWLWKATDDDGRVALLKSSRAEGEGLKAFAIAVQKSCDAIGVCRQFATAQKHYGVQFDRSDVYYEVQGSEGGGAEGSTRMLIYVGGRAFMDVDVYTTALIAWARLYVYIGYPSAQNILALLPTELWPGRGLKPTM